MTPSASLRNLLLAACISLSGSIASAQMMRPPAFAGGIPGRAQFESLVQQRHQARTLLYREALEELRKNPAAADLPTCGNAPEGPCLALDNARHPHPEKKGSRRIALLIGNNQYLKPIPPLETPLADVSAMANVLRERFGFEARVVSNAGQQEIIAAMNQLATSASPEDQVLVFYAGHGYLLEDIRMGFWIPSDASVATAKGWISNQDISKLLGAIRARQLILISDSCFSGSLTREERVGETVRITLDDLLKRRAVVALSSGGDEPVSDEGRDGHSIFAWNLLRLLRGIGDTTSGNQIWRTVRGEVMKSYPQEPQYGAIMSAGHVAGGDFLFLPR